MIARATSTATATLFALVSATLMIAHQVGGKATRDAIFLSHYDITDLPKMVIVAALMSMLAVVVMSRMLARFGPWRVVPAAYLVSATLFIGSWSIYGNAPELAALTLYVQMAVFGAVLISGFWSVVNERFDPHTAKRTVAQIAAAATLGGVIGGFMADRVAAILDARAMMVVLGGLHFACAFSVFSMGRPRVVQHTADLEMQSGIQILFRNRYLLMMGLLMVLVAALAALVDYAFKAEAARQLDNEAALVSLFGRFYAVAGLVTFAVQGLLGRRTLNRFGIGATLAVMPAVVLAACVLNTFVLRLWTVVLLRGGQMVFQNSFFRSAFELLYTPLPPARKRPTKSIIDVASDRLGDIVGGGIVLALLALTPELPPALVIGAAMLIAMLTLWLVARLYRGYVGQLADNLRDGVISITDDEIVDATTRRTLAETSAASERRLLMERMQQVRRRRDRGQAPDETPISALARALEALERGDRSEVAEFLDGSYMNPHLAPFVVPLLADDELAEIARTELRWIAPRCTGALTDAMLDPDVPLLARQRLPGVLEISHHPRAVDALVQGLADTEFNVRFSCARALSRMQERDSDLGVDRVRIFAICAREVAVDADTWGARDLGADDIVHGEHTLAGHAGMEPDYSREHVFTLLSLVLDRDALHLSLRALDSSDRDMRGTALEYLENVLPEEIRTDLWRHLGLAPSPRRQARGVDTVLRDLKRGVRG